MTISSDYPLNVTTPTQSESGGPSTVSSGAGAGTDGAYVEQIASTSFKSKFIVVTIVGHLNADIEANFDIATGAAASEVDQIIDHPYSHQATPDLSSSSFVLPFEIPSGSRVATRIKDDNVSAQNYSIGIEILG